LKCKISGFVTALNGKWSAVNRTATKFISKTEGWLDTEFILQQNENKTVDKRSRPSKLFYDVSERSKIRKVKSLVNTTSPERLLPTITVSLFK
jgi:hypothetical protein